MNQETNLADQIRAEQKRMADTIREQPPSTYEEAVQQFRALSVGTPMSLENPPSKPETSQSTPALTDW